ncbi:hypothetical protein [Chryseobacterium pennipullorum]|nr:hypothetical protein [Chryseobacterium pennipullorum]
MKKLLLMAGGLVSFGLSAQISGDLYIQNYTPHYVEYNIVRSNTASVTANCSPSIQSAPSTGLSKLTYSTNPGVTPAQAYYSDNINTSNTFNASFPDTPLINGWSINTAPAIFPVLPVLVAPTQWSGMKFGIQDTSGTNIGGFYWMGKSCGGPIVADLSSYTNAVVSGQYYTLGGASWFIIY